jgi:DNA polymerase V
MEEAVAAYTACAAEKMRRQNLTTASLQVFVHTDRFRMEDAQHFATQSVQLPIATADTGKLTSAALRGLAAIWKQGYRYNKAGVIFLDLRPATEVQGTLFDQSDTPARKRLMRVLDGLNARYGRDTVTYAASGRRREWKLRSDQLSPRYTTDWEELLSVR